jgi:hypothetical protein
MTMAILLIGVMSLLSACGQSKPEEPVVDTVQSQEQPQKAEETFELHGDYAIDITDLGMALKFYLRIREDNTFVLSANRQFSDDRGSGTIGELDGTYLMIYSDSTPEHSKTATFERVGPNLIFRSTLPYGSANISFEKEDEENPEIVYYLMADKYVYEEYYDTYLGYQSVDGVKYDYVLDLGAGARYKLVSDYALGEGLPVYEEKGSFRVSGGNMLITPEGEEELMGSILEDGALELDVKPKNTVDRTKVLFRVATTAEHAGTWHAQNEAGVRALLDLDYFGGYTFTSSAEDGSYREEGTFEVTQGTITFTKEGQELSTTGTKEGYVLKASFDAQQWNFYDVAIQGQFSGGTMVNEAYAANMQLEADGTYTLEILDQEGDLVLVSEAGLFTITAGPMSYMITLNAEDAAVRVGDIWPTGLNMTFDISGTNYSFLLTK